MPVDATSWRFVKVDHGPRKILWAEDTLGGVEKDDEEWMAKLKVWLEDSGFNSKLEVHHPSITCESVRDADSSANLSKDNRRSEHAVPLWANYGFEPKARQDWSSIH